MLDQRLRAGAAAGRQWLVLGGDPPAWLNSEAEIPGLVESLSHDPDLALLPDAA